MMTLEDRDVTAVQYYLENGADANVKHGPYLVSALHLATALRLEEAVDLLLQHRADVNAIESRGISPLHIAAGAGSHVLVSKYIAGGALIKIQDGTRNETPLHSAAYAGHAQVVEQLIDAGAKVMIYQLNYKSRVKYLIGTLN